MPDIGYLNEDNLKEVLERIRIALASVSDFVKRKFHKDTGGDEAANFGETVVVDTSSRARTVVLPKPHRLDDVGKEIVIRKTGTANTCKVLPPLGHTIDGLSFNSLSGGIGVVYLYTGGTKWITVSGSSGGWVWIPTDEKTAAYACTQFYELVLVDNSGGGITVTLPKITASDIGKMVAVKGVAGSPGGAITIAPYTGQTTYDSEVFTTAKRAVIMCAVTASKWAAIYDFEPELMG